MEPDVTDAPDRLAGRFAFCLEEPALVAGRRWIRSEDDPIRSVYELLINDAEREGESQVSENRVARLKDVRRILLVPISPPSFPPRLARLLVTCLS